MDQSSNESFTLEDKKSSTLFDLIERHQFLAKCRPCGSSRKHRGSSRGHRRRSRRKMSLFQTICSQAKRKRRKIKKRSCARKCRRGKRTRNPFFNFLRDFRRKNCGKSAVEVSVQGAKIWREMPDRKKLKYVRIACKAKPYKRKPRAPRRGRSRSRSRSRSRKCRR